MERTQRQANALRNWERRHGGMTHRRRKRLAMERLRERRDAERRILAAAKGER